MKSFWPAACLALICGVAACRGADALTVINLPPGPAPQLVGTDTVLNVLPGGVLPSGVNVEQGGVIHIAGGEADTITAGEGGSLHLSQGELLRAVGQDPNSPSLGGTSRNYLSTARQL